MKQKFEFEFEYLEDISSMNESESELLIAARNATKTAYAPYSNFKVGAAALLSNGRIIIGSNQESTSYPVGICAERTLLNSIGSQFSSESIIAMAISYDTTKSACDTPISPCGMCRQSLLDFENRYESPIKIILAGKSGPIMVMESAKYLLPFGFDGSILK
ncbi:MAG: cytidine deaminase [Sediminibacterium sp.]|jgi:cytidine deaminase